MKKFKITELEGATLDLAVSKAICLTEKGALRFGLSCPDWLTAFRPSESWSHGGIVIERMAPCDLASVLYDYGTKATWYCGILVNGERVVLEGPTPLIAAMRAVVFSRFGETIELKGIQ